MVLRLADSFDPFATQQAVIQVTTRKPQSIPLSPIAKIGLP